MSLKGPRQHNWLNASSSGTIVICTLNKMSDRLDSGGAVAVSNARSAMSCVWSRCAPTADTELAKGMSEPQALTMLRLCSKSLHSAGRTPLK